MRLIHDGKNLVNIFNSFTASLDVFCVLEDLKPVCQLILKDSEIKTVKDFCEKKGLFMEMGSYKILRSFDTGKGCFSNLGIRVPLSFPEGEWIVYISKDIKRLKDAKKHELDHKELGLILGYPECCADFFVRTFNHAKGKQMDFIIPSVDSFGPHPFQNNYMLRYFDISLIDHFPCSPKCKESLKLGRRNLLRIKKHDKEAAGMLFHELRSLVIYTEYNGVFYTRKWSVKDRTINFSDLHSTIDNRLYRKLLAHKKITLKNFNDFMVEDERFRSDAVVVAFE